MPIIGSFRREGDGFTGRISTLGIDAAVHLIPAARISAKAPDFRVLLGEHEVGAAWKADPAHGALLNLKLDDPTWPEPINARLLAAEEGVLPLSWIRQKVEVDKPAAPPGSD